MTVKATSLSLSKSEETIYTKYKRTVQLKPKTAGYSKTVTYASSQPKVAKVDKNGKITALKNGTALITVKANGRTVTCKILVKSPSLKVSNYCKER